MKGIEAALTQRKGFKSELLWTQGSFEAGLGLGSDFGRLLMSIIHFEKGTGGKKQKLPESKKQRDFMGMESGVMRDVRIQTVLRFCSSDTKHIKQYVLDL